LKGFIEIVVDEFNKESERLIYVLQMKK